MVPRGIGFELGRSKSFGLTLRVTPFSLLALDWQLIRSFLSSIRLVDLVFSLGPSRFGRLTERFIEYCMMETDLLSVLKR